jgi:hypothetical protein
LQAFLRETTVPLHRSGHPGNQYSHDFEKKVQRYATGLWLEIEHNLQLYEEGLKKEGCVLPEASWHCTFDTSTPEDAKLPEELTFA